MSFKDRARPFAVLEVISENTLVSGFTYALYRLSVYEYYGRAIIHRKAESVFGIGLLAYCRIEFRLFIA